MERKRRGIVGLVIVLCCLTVIIIIGVSFFSGKQITRARCVVTDNGSLFMDYNNRPIQLNNVSSDDYNTGDELLILHQDAFAESYPEQTGVYFTMRLEEGTRQDVSDAVLKVLTELGYLTPSMSKNFTFSLTFDTYGFSSYDSRTGELIKISDATKPEDYMTTMHLDEETMEEVYDLLCYLDIQSYPDNYDPINAPNAENIIASEPSRTLILTVRTEEWQALPEPEAIYQ